jgi:hypothetical protein
VTRIATAAVTSALVLLAPALAYACPVCFSGNEENRTAYFVTFVLLTVLPLLSIGGIVYWLVRRIRRAEAAAEI